ncbi:MAG TPA: amino acid adenylation domain-containing protein [Thermoanaerobaculia bacterium]|jgi:amino acid adenylation domain-containing protein
MNLPIDLRTGPKTDTAANAAEGLHRLFEAQAARTPEAEALVAGAERLTYRELDARAGRLARRLAGIGVGPEIRVGIFLGRSAELAVALLAVLKAGGAYVPLDPAYPEERLAWMLADSGAAVVLTEAGLRGRLPAHSARILCVDALDGTAAEAAPVPALDGNLAYLIYTSGSTGRPKAIAIEHRSAVAMARWAGTVWGPEELRGVLFSTSICFDMSVFELFATLAWGGRVILAENALALPGLAARDEVTLIDTVPSAMAELVRQGAVPASVRTVNLGGEAVRRSLVAGIYGAARVERVWNLYGPSEDTTFSTFARLDAASGETPAIGRPVEGTEGYVLDGDLRPVSSGEAGEPGELYLAGAGLARGYLDRPDLTAERFVPDPFSTAGERMYRTGDRVRRRASGELEFLGRADHQVKVRGFRVELEEIAAILDTHPAVGQSVVVLREDVEGDPRLVAYISPSGAGDLDGADLRGFVQRQLPAYAVPAAFVPLARLPLSANGKVDRQALPAPDWDALERESAYTAPRTPVEAALARIWADLLGLRQVGIADDFLRLGGHSLLMAQALTRVREALGVEVPLSELFRNPTVAELAAVVERARRGDAQSELPELPPVRPVPRDGRPLPLSFAQERVWFLDQLTPGGNLAYNVQLAIRLRGPWRVDLLERSLSEIVRRHEVLRTAFPAVDGRPVQVIRPPVPVRLPEIDLRALPEPRRGERAGRLIAETIGVPFDLATAPLVRWRLLRLDEETRVLVQVEHHFVHDGWSLAILLGELQALYAAFSRGERSPLPELPVQYADYAVWQRRWMQGETLDRLLAWWKERLTGLPAALEIATDRPRPAESSFRGDVLALPLEPDLYDALRRFGRARGLTLYTTMLAGFLALLHRYTGEEDVVIGTSNANRRARELEGVIGMMVNSLALRADLSGNPGFQDLLGRVRELALETHAHQDLPFERLVQELRVERRAGRNPVFQWMFNFHDSPVPEVRFGGLEMAPEILANGTAKMDVNVIVIPRGEQRAGRGESAEDRWASLRWEYNTDLFDAATVRRLDAHYRTLLAGALADPRLALSELPLLSAPERAELLHGWNDTAALYPEAAIPDLFGRQAAATPEAVAVVFGAASLTYGELDARANRLAHHLRALGAGPGELVALAVPRSLDLAPAILGILKSGAAYVPLDLGYPAERVAFMLADTGALLVVDGDFLCNSDEAIARVPATPPPGLAGPDDLAYVMYTSGSTGRPKGVAVTHRNVVRLVHGSGFARFGPDEVFLQLAPVSFDASTLELWGPLLHGGRLAIFPPETPTPASLAEAVERHGVTTLWLTAGLFHQVAEGDLSGFRSLRQLLAGGDVLSPAHVARTLARLPGLTLIDGYGPTEGTTFTCCHPIHQIDPAAGPVPIGRPIGNARVHVVDSGGAPAPVGVPGELLIGGDGLAAGYLHRPALTAERFIPDFFGPPGGRLYRTGDLARWRPGGTLEFLGRIDQQVKIRGFRVEPGEVEAALAEHPAVAAAAVVVERRGGEARLLAYVVPAPGRAGLREELRDDLRRRLPEFMLPAAVIELAALPLTPNGKVDRRALPAPADPAAELADTYIAPRGPAEEILVQIWSEVLGVERVGVEDDLFSLGGHSLLAIRILSRTAAVFGIEVPLPVLFEAPTVAGVAAHLAQVALQTGGKRPDAPPLRTVRRDRPLPLSFGQQRLWFLHQMEPESPAYHTSRRYRLAGPLRPARLEEALRGLVERHEILRTRYHKLAGEPVQSVSRELPALSLVDLGGLPEAAREPEERRLAGELFRRPFDLAAGLPLRACLLRRGEDDHLFLLSLHHIALDGWSMGILQRELGALYEDGDPLPDLAFQYGDFAAWQRGWLKGPVLKREVDFWRARLAGAPALLELPADRPRPPMQRYRGGRLPARLPAETSAALAALARRQGATPFMLLLAALGALLHRLAGQDDVVVGTPVANRNRPEIEGLIGFFVNTLALRADLSGRPRFADLLARVRRTTLDVFGHQELPFEKLVEALQPERSLAHAPIFQVLLVLQSAPLEPLRLAGLDVEEAGFDTGTAKFDLTLDLGPTAAGLAGTWEYDRDLFDGPTVERLAGAFERLLAAAAAEPETPVSELPLLSPAERRQLLAAGSGEPLAPEETCLHQLFAAQVAKTPDAEALIAGHERLTYHQLDARAGRLARRLRRLGVGPEARVGIFLTRSAEMVVALLAALKAGGAYVPLDPAHPEERLAWTLEDSGVSVVLTEAGLRGRLPPHGAAVLCLEDREDDREEAADAPVLPGNLAYLIYTSGSTGRPKAVGIEHRSAVAMVRWARAPWSDAELRGVLFATSIGFDLSVFELFVPLSRGGRVILAENALALPALPARGEVTLINTVPSAMAELVRQGALPPSVRTVNLAGEALKRPLVDGVYAAGVERVWNLYGPSEDTTYSTFALIGRGGRGAPAIGRPVDGTRAHVLDRDGELAPPGVPGELHLAGAGLARGYLGRPELTAERFVPDPFAADQPGGRMYRTGDLARWRPASGGRELALELEYLGRTDHQVKLRGFRIELGEIEAVLAAHPDVEQSVVVMREDLAGDPRLVAYVVAARELEIETLRGFLQRTLPSYAVPAAFVPLAGLPLSANGKVDRRALPAPERARPAGPVERPRTDLERLIARHWEELLGRAEVSLEDNFFDLGGHSLLIHQVQGRLENELGRPVSTVDLFRFPTVRSLAGHLQGNAAESAVPARVAGAGQEARAGSAARRRELRRQSRGGAREQG